MIQFPIKALLSEEECHDYLERTLHPEGLRCPRGHPLPVGQAPHDPGRAPIFKYKCRLCGAVYHLFTGTLWSGSHYDIRIVTLLMRGFLQGVPTSHLAKELGLDRGNLLKHRRRIQQLALQHKPETPLSDGQTEADEMFQNAGEKGQLHPDPKDPPRRRANKRQGRGTMGNDRPPILGVLGRESGQIRLTVCEDTKQKTLQPQVESDTEADTALHTDESNAYHHLAETGRGHATVNHTKKEWARDDDGDGIREVHCNTIEGIWTGLRNFLRPFRGVHKKNLAAYVAIFEWAHNLKRVTAGLLRTLMIPGFTYLPT